MQHANKTILKKSAFILLLASFGVFQSAWADNNKEKAESDAWRTDFEAAKAEAAKEEMPMLLNFTGSDWCHWCQKLDDEVFSQSAFKEYADNLVLVKLDFPRNKEQSEEVKQQNRKLAQKYGVQGFPTILVLSPEGELVKKTGYRPDGAEAYVKHLKSIVSDI
ncbi:MAG: thioredoxin family protein [Opitutales bacterium]